MDKISFEKLKKWDEIFFDNCNRFAKHSKCLSRKVGAVIVKDHCQIAGGYNGPPRNVPHCDERYLLDKELIKALNNRGVDNENPKYHQTCPRRLLGYKSGEGLRWCIAAHAEENAILQVSRLGGPSLKGTTLYLNDVVPCSNCLIKIINSGISEVVCIDPDEVYTNTTSEFILKHQKTFIIRQYTHL